MPTKPWVTFRRPDPEREYLVLLSELPLQRFRDLAAFFLYSWRIQRQGGADFPPQWEDAFTRRDPA